MTTFTRDQLIKFGQYLLSVERKKSFKAIKGLPSVRERLAEVNHADVENAISSFTNNPGVEFTKCKQVILKP